MRISGIDIENDKLLECIIEKDGLKNLLKKTREKEGDSWFRCQEDRKRIIRGRVCDRQRTQGREWFDTSGTLQKNPDTEIHHVEDPG